MVVMFRELELVRSILVIWPSWIWNFATWKFFSMQSGVPLANLPFLDICSH